MKVLSPKDVLKCRRFHHIVPSSETVSWRIQQDIGDVGDHVEQYGEQTAHKPDMVERPGRHLAGEHADNGSGQVGGGGVQAH
jgi:hypothetical protein